MKESNIHQVLVQKYSYDKTSPEFVSVDQKYKVFKGTQKEIALNVTIKILMSSIEPSLGNYLNKLKNTKSQQVIKIHQIVTESNFLVVVTEQIVYGSLASGLLNCKKFDQNDATYVGKYLLSGYTDVLRSGIQWYGTLNDLQITQTGIKLSWNNTLSISPESSNTFKEILEQISSQRKNQSDQRLLPFPESKILKELIKLAQSSASEISLSPIMKKKQKYLKKKFKSYILIRQTKNPNEYYQESIYLGASKQHGFVRIKCYKKGTINQNILQLNKSKGTFTRVVQVFQQNNLIYIVSLYSNDGNLQNYVQRLKVAGTQLKEDQIQFFLYSLFEPLKGIQQSSIKSLNTSLNIKNIYIQSGIPKIGQPLPMNQDFKEKLKDRADVPDFYHTGYKNKPDSSDPSFDTYSLGVLLYKLMYVEYPIFPNGKVHIPTTPTYNARLKKTLQIFLDEGGKLADIQKKIQVSEQVLKQVKKNKQKLLLAKKNQQKKIKGNKKKYQQIIIHQDQDDVQNNVQRPQDTQKDHLTDNHQQQQQNIEDDCFQCFTKLQMADHSIDPQVQSLQESPYKVYRLCTKFLCFLLLYVLLMYMFYLGDNIGMLIKQSNLMKFNVTISTVRYQIITEDQNEFYLVFNQTNKVLPNLINMGCLINSYNGGGNYSDMVYSGSLTWMLFLCGGLGLFALIIIMKSILIFKFDYIKTKYNYQHNITNFNYVNYLVINLFIASLIHEHFSFFNIIFYSTMPACLGNYMNRLFSTIDFMFNYNDKVIQCYFIVLGQFMYVHLPVLCGLTLVVFIHFIVVYNTHKIKYSKVSNPVIFCVPIWLTYLAVVRLGVISAYFYPTLINDSQGIIKSYFKQVDYIGVIGIVPEILFLLEFIINKLIDLVYWLLIDKKRRVMIQQNSTENIQIYNQ